MDVIATVLFGLAGLLGLVSLLPPLADRLALPYTVLLGAAGVALGVAAGAFRGAGGLGGDFMRAIDQLHLTPADVLNIFLPPLLFDAVLALDVRKLVDDAAAIVVMAVVAVALTTVVAGVALWWASGVGLVACLLVGAIISTTDPAAVVGIFRDLGAPRRLQLLVEGESLFNDAAAIAIFTLLVETLVGSRSGTVGGTILDFVRTFAGGIAVGYLTAWAICGLITLLRNLPLSEISLTVSLAYLAYILAEHYVHVSGVVAVVTASLVVGSTGRTRISPMTWSGLIHVWQQLGFWASSLIFLLAATLVPPILRLTDLHSLALLAVLSVAALAARAIVLFGLLPVLSTVGVTQRIDPAFKAVMLWGGLRGAVSLALALAAGDDGQIAPGDAHFITVLAIGFVIVSLLVNGTTLRPLMRLLHLDRLSPADLAMRNRAMALALSTIRDSVETLARNQQIEPELARATADHYAARLTEVEWGIAGETALSDRDRTYIGLLTVSSREESIYRRHFQDRIVSRRMIELLDVRTARLQDAARSGGREAYQRAVVESLRFHRFFRIALALHQWLGWTRPLAEALSQRFDELLVTRMALRELAIFNRGRIARLLGPATSAEIGEVLAARLAGVEKALSAMRLQYPDYAETQQRRYLHRVAIRLEENNYRTLFTESVINREILNDLEHDLATRRAALDRAVRLRLGLDPVALVARVPMFAGLESATIREIARVLKPRLAVPDEVLVRRGEPGDAMYFLSSGAVEVHVPGQHPGIQLGSGEFFGEMALLSGDRRSADVVALGYCNLLVLTARDFARLRDRHPGLRDHIGQVASSRRAALGGKQGGGEQTASAG